MTRRVCLHLLARRRHLWRRQQQRRAPRAQTYRRTAPRPAAALGSAAGSGAAVGAGGAANAGAPAGAANSVAVAASAEGVAGAAGGAVATAGTDQPAAPGSGGPALVNWGAVQQAAEEGHRRWQGQQAAAPAAPPVTPSGIAAAGGSLQHSSPSRGLQRRQPCRRRPQQRPCSTSSTSAEPVAPVRRPFKSPFWLRATLAPGVFRKPVQTRGRTTGQAPVNSARGEQTGGEAAAQSGATLASFSLLCLIPAAPALAPGFPLRVPCTNACCRTIGATRILKLGRCLANA